MYETSFYNTNTYLFTMWLIAGYGALCILHELLLCDLTAWSRLIVRKLALEA